VRVGVFGLGYVGSVSAACLAADGHDVIGVDVNPSKVDLINAGHSPVIEPGLERLIADAVSSGRLLATSDPAGAVGSSDVSLICVGTPSRPNGSLDLSHVEDVVSEIGAALEKEPGYHVVVVRSTVLPGTTGGMIRSRLEATSGKTAGVDFGLAMNPEFLREGSAIVDYRQPAYTLVGELDVRSGDAVEGLFSDVPAPVVRVDLPTAEMAKYVSNAFHALKVAFANEVGTLAKLHGVDGREVMEIFSRDRQLNISDAYLKPGFAFVGSCLPKDTRALSYRARELDADSPLISSIIPSNEAHIRRAIAMVEQAGARRVGILGLSFKSGTDDVRESPAVPLIETLVGRGYHVAVYDEHVRLNSLVGANKVFLEDELPHIASLLRPSVEEVVAASEVVVVAHGSPEFKNVPHLLSDGQLLIDLSGIARDEGVGRGSYEGIGW
jgi:GDP-mannose 6-dehydrogenase